MPGCLQADDDPAPIKLRHRAVVAVQALDSLERSVKVFDLRSRGGFLHFGSLTVGGARNRVLGNSICYIDVVPPGHVAYRCPLISLGA